MIRAVIVEDEEKSRKLLKNLLEKYCREVEIVGLADNVQQGVALIEGTRPELVFLDIVMPGGDGFRVLEKVSQRGFEVIFTTAYDEYAIHAIRESALAYLLKPINVDELEEAVQKAAERIKDSQGDTSLSERLDSFLNSYQTMNQDANKIGIPTQSGIRFIAIKDISYCKAEGNYTLIYLADGAKKEMVSRTLKEFEEQLKDYNFIRAHRSYLINLDQVKEYSRSNETGDIDADGGCVTMLNGAQLPVSREKRKILLKKFSHPF